LTDIYNSCHHAAKIENTKGINAYELDIFAAEHNISCAFGNISYMCRAIFGKATLQKSGYSRNMDSLRLGFYRFAGDEFKCGVFYNLCFAFCAVFCNNTRQQI